jgi:hypothetical protein
MKVLIDIPDKDFGIDIQDKFQDFFSRVKVEIEHRLATKDILMCGNYEKETAEMFLSTFKDSKVLSKMTNGEVIQTMLNPYKICEYKYSVHVYMTEKDFWNGNYQMNLDSDWWNAPYKKGE